MQGIVFSVRPPKKSWKNISNLSGGEKTLSSLSLVFALHHYKPTPLYVMDEIDAALGEPCCPLNSAWYLHVVPTIVAKNEIHDDDTNKFHMSRTHGACACSENLFSVLSAYAPDLYLHKAWGHASEPSRHASSELLCHIGILCRKACCVHSTTAS